MMVDQSFIERNRAATERIRELAGRGGEAMQARMGQHWTVAIMLAHLAFWDLRALTVLERTEREGKLNAPIFDDVLNDLMLPFWAAIPAGEAARLAVDYAQALDDKLANYPPELLALVDEYNHRWVDRSIHRNLHIDEALQAIEH